MKEVSQGQEHSGVNGDVEVKDTVKVTVNTRTRNEEECQNVRDIL